MLCESENSSEIKGFLYDAKAKIKDIDVFIKNNSNYQVLPIDKLIELQMKFLLLTLEYAN